MRLLLGVRFAGENLTANMPMFSEVRMEYWGLGEDFSFLPMIPLRNHSIR